MPYRPESSRREFLKRAVAAGLVASVPVPAYGFLWPAPQAVTAPSKATPASSWARVDTILARIAAPTFPARDFDVTKYGAIGDGVALCTDALRQAIAACHAAGGGRVVVPAGRFLTGAIHLKSRVNLHVSDGATIAFSRDPRHYLPVVFTRWEGVELMNYSALIYAFEQENIAVTGKGTLDGQADDTHWWPWKGQRTPATAENQNAARAKLIEMGAAGVPVAERVFGDGAYLRPNFIQPYRCTNVLIDGVTLINSPMWEVHPVLCTNVTVRNVSINSHGPNNDGCDPESCRDVLIEGCTFDTGDDCIALKSGRNTDGRRVNVPVENVIIQDCVMKDGHGGVVIGSEISGGARYVYARRCRMDSPQLDRALRIKTNSVRGGTVEHIYMRDVTVGQVAEAVVTINYFYEEGDAGQFPPIVRDVEVRNVTSRKSQYGLLLRGFSHDPIQDVRLVDCTFDDVAKPDVVEAVKGLSFTNVRINGVVKNEVVNR
jgi:polygalacturonase